MQIKLHNLAHIRAGYQTRKRIETDPKGGYFILQIRDFDDARTSLDSKKLAQIEAVSVNEDQILREGDVIFLAKGARNFSFAPTKLPWPTLAAPYFFVLRPNPEILPGYLAWFLNLDATKQAVSKLATQGAHMPVVRREVLEELEVPLPDLATQQKVVELAELMRQQQELLAKFSESQKTLFTEVCLRLANQSHKKGTSPV